MPNLVALAASPNVARACGDPFRHAYPPLYAGTSLEVNQATRLGLLVDVVELAIVVVISRRDN